MNRSDPTLGLRANWRPFWLLVGVNAFVGAMVGLERAILPLLAEDDFGIASRAGVLSFIATFGVAKALTNLAAGRMGDRLGRKPVLVAGWLFGLPVPFMMILAPDWSWVLAANVLLGINQGLAWSTTVIMKIDLVGPRQRGLAMGLNEFAGYLAVALAALGTGLLAEAYGLRPVPFYLGIGIVALGLFLSVALVGETRSHMELEERIVRRVRGEAAGNLPALEVLARVSWRDPALSSASQAGMVNNLNDGMAWGLFPLLFAAGGMTVSQIGVLAFVYPAVWGLAQLGTGALSDRWGRKGLIVGGMILQAGALFLVAGVSGFWPWAGALAVLGLGTAMVYPTLLAAIGDRAGPAWRASAVGVYRLWRDGGYVVGALVAGLVADRLGLTWAVWVVAGLTFLSGILAWVRMPETRPVEAVERSG